MSDERRKQSRKWAALEPALAVAFVLLAAYQSTHYATAAVSYAPGACMGYCTHKISGTEVPLWVNELFWPAELFDELIGGQGRGHG